MIPFKQRDLVRDKGFDSDLLYHVSISQLQEYFLNLDLTILLRKF